MLGSAASRGGRGRGSSIYGPRNLEDGFLLGRVKSEIQPVLQKIEKIYSRVKVADREHLSTAGFCFGLLDPVTNILVNSLLYAEARKQAGDVNQQARAAQARKQAGDMNQLALESLVAFLTYLFPYLSEAEAVGYLRVTKADPLAAAGLIFLNRGLLHLKNSEATHSAVVTALRCAAAAVKLDGVEFIVDGWLNVDLAKLSSLGARSRPEVDIAYVVLNRTSDGSTRPGAQLSLAWELAQRRFADYSISKELTPAPAIGTMKRLFLARIHGYYLQALSIFPTDELRKRYHRSMLMGGHCYGPLLHPVANIIMNTIWYEQNFPTSKLPEVDMISTKCLWRVAAQSLYGLVSFLCTRYHLLTPDLALQRLMAADASLQIADPKLVELDPSLDRSAIQLNWFKSVRVGSRTIQHSAVEATRPSDTVNEAYLAAATAALHPNPHAQRDFLSSADSHIRLQHAAQSTGLNAAPATDLSDCILSAESLEELSSIVSYNPSHQQQVPEPLKFKKWVYPNAVEHENEFWDQQKRVKSMVTAALAKFNMTKEHQFELHIICGVNEQVGSRLLRWGMKRARFNPLAPAFHHRSHVNFLAVPKGKPSAAVLFFAEYDNYKKDGNSNEMDEDSSYWCVPMNLKDPGAEQIRCIYCEHEGSRIVHPIMEGFCGRDEEFEKVLLGEPPSFGCTREHYGNDMLIEGIFEDIDWVYDLEDDSIYTEYCLDEDDNGGPEDWVRRIPVV